MRGSDRRAPRSIAAVLATLLLLATTSALEAARPDPRLEPFDPRADYGYELAIASAGVHEVDLVENGFAWPSETTGDTAFLAVELLRARHDAPALRVRGASASVLQVFEGGARGRRFVDVTPLLRAGVDAGEAIVLEPDGIRVARGASRLYTFRNPSTDGLGVLVVAPHPDDAEIAAFGLYSRTDADVVTVTSGDAGAQGFAALFPDPGEHYRVKGWIRTWDSITVPFFGGVAPGRARNLGYYDATLRTLWEKRPAEVEPLLAELENPGFYRALNLDPDLEARPFTASWPGLVGDLRAELERVKPRVVVAPHPLLDRHRDHQFVTVALLEALESWPGECELWLYTNHAIGNESWPFGPRDAMMGLPPWPSAPPGDAAAEDLFFSRLYSHPLDSETRRLKQVALEAMHDLRPFDLRDAAGAPSPSRRERWEARRYDYFRRAPRPNEVFFVLEPDDAQRLRSYLIAHPLAEPERPPGG